MASANYVGKEGVDELDAYDSSDDIIYDDLGDDDDDLSMPTRKRKSILLTASTSKRRSYTARFASPTSLVTQKKLAKPATTPKNRVKHDYTSLASKIDRLCEFAHVLMHCILYKINYYSKKTHFDKFLKYNIIVYVSGVRGFCGIVKYDERLTTCVCFFFLL